MPASSKKVEKKRKRNRKARTEVSPSPSSSSSSSSSSPPPPPKQKPAVSPETVSPAIHKQQRSATPSPDDEPQVDETRPNLQPQDPESAFADFYLRQSTREFADDLEKLRAAKDFHGASSVGLLVRALRQGGECFTAEERRRIGTAASNEEKP